MAESTNDDRTVVIAETAKSAPASGTGVSPHNALPIGTRLGEFEIVGLVGEGGFGIVYLAEDHSLGRKVAVKEYMPSSLAGRGNDSSVVVRSARHQETFEIGLRSFVNEARLLAQFDHPALVKVYRFWEANGTAYMAMPYYKGKTLRDTLKERVTAPDESWIRKILMPVMEALEVIHREHCFHRDIAPDNIMLLADERPVLLDFGAARRVISDMTQALTVILKPGYAPIEQYAEMPGMKQGPWTDIYALAAVVYFMIERRTPPPAVGRMMQDSYQPLAQTAAGRFSENFLRGIDKCLSVKAEDRPQSIAEMREALGLTLESPLFAPVDLSSSPPAATIPDSAGDRLKTVIKPAGSATGRRNTLVIAATAALAGVLGGGYWYFTQHGRQPERPDAATTTASAPMEAPSPAPAAKQEAQPTIAMTPPVQTAPVAPPVAEPKVEPPAPPPLPPAFANLASAIRAVTAASDSRMAFRLDAPKAIALGDSLKFSLNAKAAGYLYLFLWDSAEDRLYRLFPNRLDTDNTLKAGASFSVPRTRLATPWAYAARAPQGNLQLLALLSEHPRDFSRAVLGEEGDFLVVSRDELEAQLSRHAGVQSFIGAPQCGDADTCAERYAASVVAIAEKPAPAPVATGAATSKKAPVVAPAADQPPARPSRRSASSGADTSPDAEREYMKQLNKDLDKLLGK